MVSMPDRDPFAWIAKSRAEIRDIGDDLLGQGVKLYPATETGRRARFIWQRIKSQLIRGGAVQVTVSALSLGLHREELRRAKMVLVEMGLIKPRGDGLYVLGSLGPCPRIDELIREDFFILKSVEEVVVALAAITKSKT